MRLIVKVFFLYFFYLFLLYICICLFDYRWSTTIVLGAVYRWSPRRGKLQRRIFWCSMPSLQIAANIPAIRVTLIQRLSSCMYLMVCTYIYEKKKKKKIEVLISFDNRNHFDLYSLIFFSFLRFQIISSDKLIFIFGFCKKKKKAIHFSGSIDYLLHLQRMTYTHQSFVNIF